MFKFWRKEIVEERCQDVLVVGSGVEKGSASDDFCDAA